MPPVTKAGSQQFRKDVAFAETKDSDEYALEASGIVMVPDKADLQNDFAREATIREFADQFETFIDAGQAQGGIMHAVWPDGWMDLERNEVLEEAEEIGGQTVDAGAWVQRWGITNADLASLVDDSILEGYSIGAIQVDWDGPYEQDEIENVDTSELPEGELVWELTDGLVREVSTVDIPAVPDAQILEAKGLDKRLADHVGNQDAFIDEAMERGHSEADAERLWDVLNAAVEAEGSSEPGKQSLFARAGKAFLSALTGSDDGRDASTSPEAPDSDSDKEGRTLSRQNRESLYATIDASLDVLHDAGVDDLPKRFTDREDTSFSLDEHTAREWPDDEDGDEDDEDMGGGEVTDPIANNAPAGETADNSTMSNDDPMADAPEWAKALDDRIDSLENADGDGDADDPMADAPEWAKDLAQRVDEIEEKTTDDDKPEWAKALEERVDQISKQTGATESQQLGGAEKNGSDENLDERQKFFIPESKRGGR